MTPPFWARSALETLRRGWLRLRRRCIPYDSRRDAAYRWLRSRLGRKLVGPLDDYERFRWLFEPSGPDPFFNPNLSCRNTHPSFRLDRRDTAVDANDRLVAQLARLSHQEMLQLPDDFA